MTRDVPPDSLPAAIKRLRESKYGSHDKMARAYGMRHRQTIINWENGKHTPHGRHIDRLLEDGLSPDLFIDRSDLARRLAEAERRLAQEEREIGELRRLLEALNAT